MATLTERTNFSLFSISKMATENHVAFGAESLHSLTHFLEFFWFLYLVLLLVCPLHFAFIYSEFYSIFWSQYSLNPQVKLHYNSQKPCRAFTETFSEVYNYVIFTQKIAS